MKKIVTTSLLLLSILIVSAQQFEPTTKWPYLYKDFKEGKIYFSDAGKLTANLNVHLMESVLHYLKSDLILRAETSSPIDSVVIGNDSFVYMGNELVKLISEAGQNKLVVLTKGDFDVLNTTTGAYGTASHTSSVNNLSSYEIGGISNMNHRQLVLEKEEGKLLPVKSEYYFIINQKSIAANRKMIKEFLDPIKYNEFEKNLKSNKLNWKKESDLTKMLKFL